MGTEGHPDWGEVLVRAFRAARLVAGGDLALAEDAASATCLALWERPHLWGEARLWGWVATVARNEVFDALRRRYRVRPAGPADDLEGSDGPADLGDPAAPDDVEAEAVGEVLAELAEAALPPDLLAVWRLRYRDGLSDRQVAEHLALAPGTVRNKLCIARRLLRRELGLEAEVMTWAGS